MEKTEEQMFDVVCVSTDSMKVLWVEEYKTERNADAIVRMAIMRQGVDGRFFHTIKSGKYKKGDLFNG